MYVTYCLMNKLYIYIHIFSQINYYLLRMCNTFYCISVIICEDCSYSICFCCIRVKNHEKKKYRVLASVTPSLNPDLMSSCMLVKITWLLQDLLNGTWNNEPEKYLNKLKMYSLLTVYIKLILGNHVIGSREVLENVIKTLLKSRKYKYWVWNRLDG